MDDRDVGARVDKEWYLRAAIERGEIDRCPDVRHGRSRPGRCSGCGQDQSGVAEEASDRHGARAALEEDSAALLCKTVDHHRSQVPALRPRPLEELLERAG